MVIYGTSNRNKEMKTLYIYENQGYKNQEIQTLTYVCPPLYVKGITCLLIH